jgi:hypothetical protein
VKLTKGSEVVELTVPAHSKPGWYTVSFSCTIGDDAAPTTIGASSRFEVLGPQSNPSLELDPTSAEPGKPVTARGKNYPSSCLRTAVNLLLDGTPVAIDSGPKSGTDRTLDVIFTVPSSTNLGNHQVVLTCSTGARATASLNVRASPDSPATEIRAPPNDPVSRAVDEILIAPARNDFARLDRPTRPDQRTEFARSIPLPSEVPWAGPAMLLSAVVFGFLFWATGFPSEPFNKTIEENRDKIRAWPSRHPTGRPVASRGWAIAAFWVLAAALLSLVEESDKPDVKTLTLALGFLIAVPVTTMAYAWPAEIHTRAAASDRGRLRFLPAALLFAAVCVALSRWAKFQPGYVYGLFAFYAPVASSVRERIAERITGRGIFLASVCLLVISLSAWLLWPPVAAAAEGPAPPYAILVLDTALAATFCLGIQTLVFGLVPITFLDGKKLRVWSWWAWAAVWGGALLLLIHVLFLKFVVELSSPADAVKACVLFLAFFALSAGCWLFFKVRHTTPVIASSRGRLATAVLVLIVAVPASIALALTIREDDITATVKETANVRAGPSRDTERIAQLSAGTWVTLDCTDEAGHGPFHRLNDPYAGYFVADSLLAFPDTRRPPPC